jgi:NAD+ diphosphatase
VTGFAFANSPLDRMALMRAKPEEVQKRRKSAGARCVWLAGDAVQFAGNSLDTAMPDETKEILLLGEDAEGQSWFATMAEPADSLKPLRGLVVEQLLPPEELSILAQARSLLHWHDTHTFCAKCGQPSQMQDAGYRRHCEACGADHFPRTDPVVIMAVCLGHKTLLGRQKSWPPGMYSALAGFMEPGETIEAAVRREVFEEVGVRLGKVDYVASQPWPFPSSLMIGMIGEAESEDLTIDENEIEAARWFEADELQLMLQGKHPDGLSASRPDAIAWHLCVAALKRIGG